MVQKDCDQGGLEDSKKISLERGHGTCSTTDI